MNKIIRLFETIKYLKFKQVYFRIFYFVISIFKTKLQIKFPITKESNSISLNLLNSINPENIYRKEIFTFLNISKKFEGSVDWNFSEYGKLWTYNLTYFDFANQKSIDVNAALDLIHGFTKKQYYLKDAMEPFPISLRGLNWIKFFTYNQIKDKTADNSLYAQYDVLMNHLEYHLLGNHLLENGFSLFFGAYYFQDERLYTKAKKILTEELEEQILNDGAHFELSPMYHQIMLFRVLDCINLVKNNSYKDKELLDFLDTKASLMLGWLEKITYENGDIPLFNDSAQSIAPESKKIFGYANDLKINIRNLRLSDSGYRKVLNEKYECVVDIGNIGPDYIPGHAHADTFNFEVYIDNKPFIIDTGLSTYETNQARAFERSTASHNTVEVNGKNSSEVWGGFRVANRAKILELTEDNNRIKATHDGYKNNGVYHTREWKFKDDKIIIEDHLNKKVNAVARLHFHPTVSRERIVQKIKTKNKIEFVDYKYAPQFNTQINSIAVEIKFNKQLRVEINI